MTDQGDGTYTYTLSVARPGDITVSVLYYTQGSLWIEYYPNQVWSGTNELTTTASNVNFDWGTGAVYNSEVDDLGAKLFYRIKSPYSGTVRFYIDSDDRTILYFDGSVVLNNPC